jgi:hypothetical protein
MVSFTPQKQAHTQNPAMASFTPQKQAHTQTQAHTENQEKARFTPQQEANSSAAPNVYAYRFRAHPKVLRGAILKKGTLELCPGPRSLTTPR